MKNYYTILGVSRTATFPEIKKAYRKLAMQYHPDINKAHDSHSKFIEINEAYEILYDTEKRNLYDELLRNIEQNVHSEITGTAQSTYNRWQSEARNNADRYSKMSIKDFQYIVLDGLVKAYDATKVIAKVVLTIALLWCFFATCR